MDVFEVEGFGGFPHSGPAQNNGFNAEMPRVLGEADVGFSVQRGAIKGDRFLRQPEVKCTRADVNIDADFRHATAACAGAPSGLRGGQYSGARRDIEAEIKPVAACETAASIEENDFGDGGMDAGYNGRVGSPLLR